VVEEGQAGGFWVLRTWLAYLPPPPTCSEAQPAAVGREPLAVTVYFNHLIMIKDLILSLSLPGCDSIWS
jgi:hypothetical protein